MPSNLLFNSENVVFDNYDNNSKTLTIKDVAGKQVKINSISITYSRLTNASLSVIVGGSAVDVDVYPEHTLGQIFTVAAGVIGIDSREKILFTNKRTGETTRDLSTTLKEFKILEDDVLKISGDGIVA